MRTRTPAGVVERDRAALTLRGVQRQYGIDRRIVAARVRDGEIAGAPIGRSVRILRADVESWIRREAARTSAGSRAATVATRRVEREARHAG